MGRDRIENERQRQRAGKHQVASEADEVEAQASLRQQGPAVDDSVVRRVTCRLELLPPPPHPSDACRSDPLPHPPNPASIDP